MRLVSKAVSGLGFAIFLLDHYQRQVWFYLIDSGLISFSLIQVLKDTDCHLEAVNVHLLCHLGICSFDHDCVCVCMEGEDWGQCF